MIMRFGRLLCWQVQHRSVCWNSSRGISVRRSGRWWKWWKLIQIRCISVATALESCKGDACRFHLPMSRGFDYEFYLYVSECCWTKNLGGLLLLQMSNQARWAVLRAFTLIKENRNAHTAIVEALERGAGLGSLIKTIEDAMAWSLPCLQQQLTGLHSRPVLGGIARVDGRFDLNTFTLSSCTSIIIFDEAQACRASWFRGFRVLGCKSSCFELEIPVLH